MNTSISVPDQVWARIPKDTIASRWITEAINHYADWVLLKNCIQSVNILASENPDLMTAWKKEDEELRR